VVPAITGQLFSGGEEGRADAVPCMVGMNADLLYVGIVIECLQPDEADGRIPLVHGDQEPAVF
jgi:hypothetical protein